MVIDFHTHVFPDAIAEKSVKILENNADIHAFTDGTAGGLLKSMREADIDISVVLPVVTNPVKADKINQTAVKITEQNVGIISFAGIHPDTPNYKEVLNNAHNWGLKGIKLHPEYQRTAFDDIRYMRILDYAEQLGMSTVVHAGYDGGYPESKLCWPQHILNVLNEVKPKRLVLAHMGGCLIWDDVKKYIAGADVYFDTAFSFGKKQRDILLTEEKFISLARAHGVNKILFATDSPWGEQLEMSQFVKNCNMTDDEKEMILAKNAAELLGIS